MERDQIVRTDFPTARKGWDPAAVSAHLEAVAISTSADLDPAVAPSLGDAAAGRIRSILEAAEQAATEIQTSSQSDADGRVGAASAEAERLVAAARSESDEVVSRATAEADAHVHSAKQAVEGLIAQAEDLRGQVADVGRQLAASAPTAEVPGPVIVPEPTPPLIPEPTPDPVPEPTPDPMPDPAPSPIPEPTPDPTPDPGPIAPPVPEPAPGPPVAVGSSTEDLIAQLRSASPPAEVNEGTAPSAETEADLGAARLVAMNMALDGVPRDEISAQLEADFGAEAEMNGVLDEVLARAER